MENFRRRKTVGISTLIAIVILGLATYFSRAEAAHVFAPEPQAETTGQIFLPLVTGNIAQDVATPNVAQEQNDFHDDAYLAELARQRNEAPFVINDSQAAATGPLNQVGQWGPVVSWPFAFASAASLPDGRIAAWGANNVRSFNGGNFAYASVWDPATGQFLSRNHNDHPLFCGIPTMMEDGRVIVNGGDSNTSKTSIFDYRTNQWTRTDNMSTGRWYPGSVMLPGDKVFTMLGRPGGPYPEVWTESDGWSLLTGANLNNGVLNYSGYQSTWLPYVHLMPNGNVFHSGPTTQMNVINPNGNGSISSAGLTNSWYPKYSTSIMYDKGKILVAGGAANDSSNSPGTNRAMIIDVNGSSPTKTNIGSMAHARKFSNGVMLPNGEVIIIGGNTSGQEFSDQGSILAAEIWNPTTRQWREVANMSVPRNYHSVALLMTDGRVWSGGGGLCNCNADHMDHQVYSPPYLFTSSGALATRPTISSAPDVVTFGSSITVQASSGIQQFSMIKMSGTTHHMNSDLRFLNVPFTGSNGQYQLTLESNINVLTPGYWMLFALDSQGTPSVAKVLNVSSTAPPPPPPPGTVLQANFDINADGFVYVDDTFRNTNAPTYAAGSYQSSGGYNGGGVQVVVGGVNDNTILGMSGGWRRNFTLDGDKEVTLSLRYRIDQAANYESDEFSQVLVSIDGALVGQPPNDYVDQITGDGNNGNTQTSGWQTFQVDLGLLTSGSHQLIIGGYNNKKTFNDESTQIRFDEILVVAADPPNQPPALIDPGNQGNTEGDDVTLEINATDLDGDTLAYSASGLPSGLSINSSTGVIAGTIAFDSAGTYNPTITVNDGNGGSDSISFQWTVLSVPVLALDPIVSTPKAQNSSISYTANFSGGLNPRFKWLFGDGTPETAYNSSATVSHTYAQPGRYIVTLTGTDDTGQEVTEQFAQLVHRPLTANQPAVSMSIIYETRTGNDRVWNVNPDNDTVTVSNAVTQQKVAEVAVGAAPRALAIAPDGRIWVTNKHDATISIINPSSLSVVQTVNLPRASQPFGIAFSPNGSNAFVTLEATGRLLKLNPSTGAQTGSTDVGPNPRHISILANSNRIYVSRFISPPTPGEETANPQLTSGGGEVVVVNASTMSVVNTITLQYSARPDTEADGRGIPNYLGPAVISPDGGAAWVPSKQDNIARGTLRDGQPLNHDHTVRSITSYIDLGTNQEQFDDRVDHDNGGIASSGQFERYGAFLFVALEGSREVAVIDAYAQSELFRIEVGHAPQGVTVSPDGLTLYVHNFMDRSIGVYDLAALINEGVAEANQLATINTVANEQLSAQVLQGKKLFYDAKDSRLALDAYISCAACHNDGGQDGRIWDMTNFGEGLRNTIDLNGRTGMGHGPLHWSANFDEIQDFENQIRHLSGGTGLMSDTDFNATQDTLGAPKAGLSADLDALAAYVSSLTDTGSSPYRSGDGTLTAAGAAGRIIFENNGCASCHAGQGFTDSAPNNLHDVGTITTASGSRLGGPLNGIDSPTLRGIWSSAPYLHDGSAATLEDAVTAHNGISLSAGDLSNLVAFLRQIDDSEPAPNNNSSPILTSPGAQTNTVGDSVNQTVTATDADGDSLSFSATGLPNGLTMNNAGVIAGTVSTVGSYNVTVTVDDGNGGSDSASFPWNVNAPANNPPILTLPGSQSSTVGDSINLTITATDADGDSLSFSATGLPAGLTMNNAGVIAGTVTTPGSFNVTVTVDDGNGGSDSASFAWNVNAPANNPPVLTSPSAQTNTVGDSINLTVSATDADGDSLSFSAAGLPDGLTMNNAGVIAGTVTTSGSFNVTVTVDDGNGGSDSGMFTWNVNAPANNPPILTLPGGQSNTVGDSINLTVTATDADGDSLSFSATGLPTGLTMNNAGVIAGTVTTSGSFNVTVTVDDGNGGSDSVSFTWTVNDVVAGCGPLNQEAEDAELAGDFVIGNDAAASGGSYIHVPEGTGNAGFGSASRVTFCFSVTTADTYQLIGGVYAPDGTSDSFFVTVDGLPASGYTWKPFRNTQYANSYVTDNGVSVELALSAGEHTVVVYLREDGTRLDTLSLEPVGAGGTNNPPVLTSPGIQVHTVGDIVNLVLSATDPDGDTLTFSASGLPSGLSLNPNTGQISGSPTLAGSYSVNLTVSDGRGGSDSASFNWVVNSDSIGCGGLSQEAEDGQLFGDFVVGSSASASGGSYIHVPDGRGNSNFGAASRATFCFNVTTADTYRLLGTISAPDGTSDSFFVTVDGLPANGYIWKTARSVPFINDYMNDNGTDVELPLAVGEHTVIVYLREDGTQLDKLTLEPLGTGPTNTPPVLSSPNNQSTAVGDSVSLSINASDADGDNLTFSASGLPSGLSLNVNTGQISGSPTTAGSYTVNLTVSDGQGGSDSVGFSWIVTDNTSACGSLNQEAEDGQLFGDMVSASDPAASGGSYIHVPEGTGNAGFGSASRAVYCFNVTEAGLYRLRGSVYAPDGTSDSFFVTVDGQPSNGYLWDTGLTAQYVDDYVNNRNGADPVELNLTAGEHTIVVYLREDGARLDSLSLEPVGQAVAATARQASTNRPLLARGLLGAITEWEVANQRVEVSSLGEMEVWLIDADTNGSDIRQSAMVDRYGRFFFDEMPVGDYLVQVRHNGLLLEEPITLDDAMMATTSFGLNAESDGAGKPGGSAASETSTWIYLPVLGR